MPDARAFSPNMVSPQHVAQAALARTDGVTLTFRVAAHGSLAECAHRARSFQQSFTAMRARARGLSQKRLGESSSARYSMARGPYDDLVCQRRVLPNDEGWAIDVFPSNLILSSLDIIDRATGQPLDTIDDNSNEVFALVTQHTSSIMGHAAKLTEAQRERLMQLRGPDVFTELGEFMSGSSLDAGADVERPKPKDLADMSDEELGGF